MLPPKVSVPVPYLFSPLESNGELMVALALLVIACGLVNTSEPPVSV